MCSCVVASYIWRRVTRLKTKDPAPIYRAFIRDEIAKARDIQKDARSRYHQLFQRTCGHLSTLDKIRFCKLITYNVEGLVKNVKQDNKNNISWLMKKQLGLADIQHSVLFNLTDKQLSEIETDVLCRGLMYGIPPRLNREQVLAEFELGFQQSQDIPVKSEKESQTCKAKLGAIAEEFAETKVDKTGFHLNKQHMQAIKSLKQREEIIISRPDKGEGVVVMDRMEYQAKMSEILEDTSKFQCIGDSELFDKTLQQERALQAYLLRAKKGNKIRKDVYDRIRPVGATCPVMYGVPKIHRPGNALRPILSMINAPQHELAKWLAELLKPVLEKFSEFNVKDTYDFCQQLDEFQQQERHLIEQSVMCSFDVKSLFTNVSLQETINISTKALYHDPDIIKPRVPEDLFVKLMKKATMDVEFRFAGTMYRHTDGVAMGSPLDPVLANIFMGYCDQQIPRSNLPLFYRRYVDDTFAVFESANKSEEFLTLLNNIHCSLNFTTEMEHENAIPFLDINVQRTGNELHRSIYRKKTFTGLYTRFDSFCPMNQKLSTLKSLVARAVKLCTPELLEQEMDKLRSIFMNNGFPIKIINKYIQQAMTPMTKDKQEGTPRRVTFKLPYIGNVSRGFSSRICETVKKAYPTTKPTVCFTTTHAFRKTPKEALPAFTKSYVIYQYTCSCAETYVGKTTQRLSERIKQHIPPNIATRKSNQADSAILAHLRNKPACVPTNAQELFRILARARSSYHLDILEAMYIRSLEPSLCAQKEFVKSLTLFT